MAASKRVIDVSEFNGTINWPSVKPNADAVIIRSGYRGYGASGALVTDKNFKANMRGAIAQKIPVGVYWLSQATSDAEALAEANYLSNLLKGYNLSYPVYLDSEHGDAKNASGRADKLSKSRRTQYGLTLLRAMRDYGHMTGLYCARSWFQTELDGEAFRKDGHSIWISELGVSKPGVTCDAWQYTWTAKIPGIQGDVDMSHYYKDHVSDRNASLVQHRFGLGDSTMDYLAKYKFADALLAKLAAGSQPVSPTDYRAQVQRRYGFDDNTMSYLDKWSWSAELYKKLAAAP